MIILLLKFLGAAQLKDHDYLRLQFLGAKYAWLGCPDTTDGICDLRFCYHNDYRDFQKCDDGIFQIIGEGAPYNTIRSGQRIRLRYLGAYNSWIGCSTRAYCEKSTCPGTAIQASNFTKCRGEILRIYARGKRNEEIIYDGDLVMLYFPVAGTSVSIQGENEGDDTSLNFCPGLAPPVYLSYGICSNNVFRIYRKP